MWSPTRSAPAMTDGITWADHVRAFSGSESARLMTVDQKRAAWADGRCGHCGRQRQEHLTQADIDWLMGRLTWNQYVAMAVLSSDSVSDSIHSGGQS